MSHVLNLIMLVGALVWFVGEALGVGRNVAAHHHLGDTTSEFVWAVEARWPLARLAVAAICVWLLLHLVWGLP